jgi:hypothetical protein
MRTCWRSRLLFDYFVAFNSPEARKKHTVYISLASDPLSKVRCMWIAPGVVSFIQSQGPINRFGSGNAGGRRPIAQLDPCTPRKL